MADPIRPAFSPLAQSRPLAPNGAGDAGARAAQRAFFSQALAEVQGQVQPQPPTRIARPDVAAPMAAPILTAPRALDPAAPVERAMRPGSLLDIKV